MRVLLTNDDGWGKSGLRLLEKVASQMGETFVVAPKHAQSGISHQLTLHRPLILEEIEKNSYSLDGTPADCVRVGVDQLGVKFDWVFSGINHGSNLGADTYVSGTVAAAREGWLQGVNSIALSQYFDGGIDQDFEWSNAETLMSQFFSGLIENYESNSRCLVNVNLPHLNDPSRHNVEAKWCELDPNPLPTMYEETSNGIVYCGNYRNRRRKTGSDIDVCFGGHISITDLCGG